MGTTFHCVPHGLPILPTVVGSYAHPSWFDAAKELMEITNLVAGVRRVRGTL